MSEIVTRIKPGNTVWWVHCTGKVYKGTVESINLCEYQGALYCVLYSPSFRVNPHPVVHYSNVFTARQLADDFAEYQMANPDDVFPKCMGCHYSAFTANQPEREEI